MRSLALLVLLAACRQSPGVRPDDDRNGPPPDATAVERWRLDRTVQIPQPAVDILFVVDNSGSMDAEQAALANNFPTFVEYFQGSGIDYHIGVVSTDLDDPTHQGLLRRAAGVNWIDADTPNPTAVFAQMAQMGTFGSADEQGRAAAWTALELRADHPRNEGFEREEAELHLIFISDEDDASTTDPVSGPEFVSWLQNRKEEPSMVRAHALVWPRGRACAEGFSEGAAYAYYAGQTDGIVGNLCAPDWSRFMDRLGLVTSGLKKQFFLSDVPRLDPWTLEVEVVTRIDDELVTRRFSSGLEGEEQDTFYLPGANSITFTEYVPEPYDEVLISYLPRTAE